MLAATFLAAASFLRTDHFVDGEAGIRLFVREVKVAGAAKTPILMLHGARVPGIASFDLPVPGGSLASDLAATGHPVFVMDARGYGRSTRPPQMSQPPEANPPLVRSIEAVRDVNAVVEWTLRRTGAKKVDLFGWATGGHWMGFYATLHPERVAHLVVLNTLYGGTDGHPLLGRGSDLEDEDNPGRLSKSLGAYRWSTASSLLSSWDRSIPLENKSEWRDPAVAEAYVAAALDATPKAASASRGRFGRRAVRWRTASTWPRDIRSGMRRSSSRRRSSFARNGTSGRARPMPGGCAPNWSMRRGFRWWSFPARRTTSTSTATIGAENS